MMRMGKANEKELEEVTKIVLAPVFHSEDVTAKKVCIYSKSRHTRLACQSVALVVLRTKV